MSAWHTPLMIATCRSWKGESGLHALRRRRAGRTSSARWAGRPGRARCSAPRGAAASAGGRKSGASCRGASGRVSWS
eukprot:4437999-Heterocapsa_arctica.AAC.1